MDSESIIKAITNLHHHQETEEQHYSLADPHRSVKEISTRLSSDIQNSNINIDIDINNGSDSVDVSVDVNDNDNDNGNDSEDDILTWSIERLRDQVIILRRQVQELRQLQAVTVAAVSAEALALPSSRTTEDLQQQIITNENENDEQEEPEVENVTLESSLSHVDSIKLSNPFLASDPNGILKPTSNLKKSTRKGKRKHQVGTPEAIDENNSDVTRKAPKRDEGTGKRIEVKRKPELAKAVRSKIRYSMGIEDEDPIPTPSPFAPPDHGGFWVPDWLKGLTDQTNMTWLDRVCEELIAEAKLGQAWRKVPESDLDSDIVKAAAVTAFHNMAKKFKEDSKPDSAFKRERWAKIRRRWGRKDLKQKRRARAALDPRFVDQIPPEALHLDYMSSEYSSQGEDTDDEPSNKVEPFLSSDQRRALRRLKWDSMAVKETSTMTGKGGWAEGQGEKVLEVRTPTWRSERLNDLYRRLDQIAAEQVAKRSGPANSSIEPTDDSRGPLVATMSSSVVTETGVVCEEILGESKDTTFTVKTTKAGHVAPSHKRFTMPRGLMRSGRGPREAGDGWMWASGSPGKWPEREQLKTIMDDPVGFGDGPLGQDTVVNHDGHVVVDVNEIIDPAHLNGVYDGTWADTPTQNDDEGEMVAGIGITGVSSDGISNSNGADNGEENGDRDGFNEKILTF